MVTHDEFRRLSMQLIAIEQRLHAVGLHATAKKVNAAVQRSGWEFAEKLKQQEKRSD